MDLTKLYLHIQEPLKQINVLLSDFEKSLLVLVKDSRSEVRFMITQGKKLRAVLLLLSAGEAAKDSEVCQIAASLELIHFASLIHDDILDNETERRGVPPLYIQLSTKKSLLLGDYILAQSLQMLPAKIYQETCQILLKQVTNMCLGEFGQMRLLSENFTLTEYKNQYLEIIENKTATLFSASCLLGCLFNPSQKGYQQVYQEIGANIGRAFQLIDDCHEILEQIKLSKKSKSFDIDNGIFTFPYLYLIEHYQTSEDNQYRDLNWLKANIHNPDIIKQIHNDMNKLEIFKDVYELISKYLDDAMNSLNQLPSSKSQKCLVDLINHLIDTARNSLL